VAGDSEESQPADADRGELLDVDATAVALVVPEMPEPADDGLPAGEAARAHDDGRVADQQQRPDVLRVLAKVGNSDGFGCDDLSDGAANHGAVVVGGVEERPPCQAGCDYPGRCGLEPVDGLGCRGFHLVDDRISVRVGFFEEVGRHPLINFCIVREPPLGRHQ
jgi:hypothetical protein